MKQILVFERAMLARVRIREALHLLNVRLLEVSTEAEAIQQITRGKIPIDLLLIDLPSEAGDEFEMIRRLKNVAHETPLVVMTGSQKRGDFISAIRSGASDYVLKPFDEEGFRKRIQSLLVSSNNRENEPVKTAAPTVERTKTQVENPPASELVPTGEVSFTAIFEEEYYRARKGRYPLTVFVLVFHKADNPKIKLDAIDTSFTLEEVAAYQSFAEKHFEDIRSQLWTSDEVVHMGPQHFYGLLPFCPEEGFKRFQDKILNFLNQEEVNDKTFGSFHWHVAGLTIQPEETVDWYADEMIIKLKKLIQNSINNEVNVKNVEGEARN